MDVGTLILQATLVIGVMVFAVNVITQVIKQLPFLQTIHTNYIATALSMVIAIGAYFAWVQMTVRVIVWYEIVAAVFLGMLVAFVAMLGWDKLIKIWNDSKAPE